MSIDTDLLELLVCPETQRPLTIADDELITQLNLRITLNQVRNKKGETIKTPLDGGLLREDGKVLYPIRDDIPDLLIEEGIPL